MSAGYELEVRAHCPNAAIVFDLFHVVAKYGRDVIDRTRVNRANELRGDKRGRRVVKSARWLLLKKSRDSLRPGEDVQLDKLLAANHALFVVYAGATHSRTCGVTGMPGTPPALGAAGTARPCAAASSP